MDTPTLGGFWMAIHVHADFSIIHSMLIHFPIAFLSLTFVIDVLGLLHGPQPDRFFDRSGFWVLTFALSGFVGALVTGKVAAASLPETPAVRSLVGRHELDAFIATAFTALAWLIQLLTKFDENRAHVENGWSWLGTGRGRMTFWSALFVTVAVVMMVFTAAHGGDLVHRYKV